MVGFRPLPVMTIASFVAFVLLVTLGTWQSQRAGDKRAQIAAFYEQKTDRVWTELDEPLCRLPAPPFGERVGLVASIVGEPVRFYGARGASEPGWRVLRAVRLPECQDDQNSAYLMVEVGFETLRGERLGAPEELQFAQPPKPNAFTPANKDGAKELYRFETAALEKALGLPAGAVRGDVWFAAYQEGLPPRLADVPPSRHIGYALTWFGLAAVLVGVYIAFHLRAGRLTVRRR